MAIVTAAGRSTDPQLHAAKVAEFAKYGVADTGIRFVVIMVPPKPGPIPWVTNCPPQAAPAWMREVFKAMLDQIEKDERHGTQ